MDATQLKQDIRQCRCGCKFEFSEMSEIVERYMNMYPAFRIKPEGAPGSQARDEQDRKMALEDAARAALASVRS